ncbi:hypothetical protein HGRIS_009698 [Hohenbuehelia grisea]|uniref:C3H1-type domain-containing protein n=1 Tax=Hohenbuehelia grisea TaxID=104357 RepID=A0ABR3J2D6_9AGAR
MAGSVAEANKMLWDEELGRMLSLANSTIKRNTELETRVADLEMEVSLWKRAHGDLRELAERDSKAHNAQLVSLNHQLSNLDGVSDQPALILCVINAESLPFSEGLFVEGIQGGQIAAQELTRSIAEQLANDGVQLVSNRLSFWTTLYFNRSNLESKLVGNDICSKEQLDGFLSGFSQASTRFAVVDVGAGKDGADAKIKEYLQTYSRFQQTLRIFVGGYATSYAPLFSVLENEQLLGRIVLLSSPKEDDDLRTVPLPTLKIKSLFMDNVSTSGGMISPQSPPRPSSGKLIDPSLPLHKQSPPPCNEHYLMNCSKGAALCKYSHGYVLTSEQLACLASNAKKAPCNWLKNGLHCPYGEKCCWGHVCPNGAKCFHLSKGKCWFKGESMHPLVSPVSDATLI